MFQHWWDRSKKVVTSDLAIQLDGKYFSYVELANYFPWEVYIWLFYETEQLLKNGNFELPSVYEVVVWEAVAFMVVWVKPVVVWKA